MDKSNWVETWIISSGTHRGVYPCKDEIQAHLGLLSHKSSSGQFQDPLESVAIPDCVIDPRAMILWSNCLDIF